MAINTIAVLGAGQMGAGIAQAAASNGYKVILRDIKQEFCDKAIVKMKAALEKRVAAGKTTQDLVDATLSNIRTVVDLEDIAEADFVIEAVPEILDLKRSTFKSLSEICRPDAVLCTNTSSISVTKISGACKNPERCAGMHFFFPVMAMKLVEIIRSEYTSDETIAVVRGVTEKMGKTPVECRTDTPGFIVNRCSLAFTLEALRCYEDGVASYQDIDTAIKLGLNHPLGPFELMDLSGVDIFEHVSETLEELPVTGWECPESVKKLISEGRLGRKSGKGWYEY